MRNLKPRMGVLSGIALGVALCTASGAAVPGLANFSGVATDSAGHRLSGPVSLALSYYDAPTAGNLLLTEAQPAVTATNGLFSTQLGGGTLTAGADSTLAGVFQNHDGVWIQIAVNADPPMTPRVQVVAVPFALRAATADGLAGISASNLLTADATPQTEVGNLTISPSTGAASALVAKGNGSNAALEVDNGALKVSGPTPTAFVHTLTAANTVSATSTITNPLTDGDPTAMLFVTRVGSSVSASPSGVSYVSGRWQINNTNFHSFIIGEQFNVLVIKR